ncbi:MAG: hypothetical protein GY944_00350 [bacterium]|nr:hypothetical protein [bacterium]MCP5039443.1 hypothetical protein [bacterium]
MQSDTLESTDQRIDAEIARVRETHRSAEARENARRSERADAGRRSEAPQGGDPQRGRRVDTYA